MRTGSLPVPDCPRLSPIVRTGGDQKGQTKSPWGHDPEPQYRLFRMPAFPPRGGVSGGRYIVHGGQCARGGTALFLVVMTAAEAKRRITPGCAGPNGDAARVALARITTFACTIGRAECSGFRDERGAGARSLGLSRPAFAAARRFAASPM